MARKKKHKPASRMPARQPHGELLREKAKTNEVLRAPLEAYEAFEQEAGALLMTDDKAVNSLVAALNRYRDRVLNTFESARNVPQENLRSTILEEFFGWLFKDIFAALGREVPANYRAGRSTASYLNMTFAPRDFMSAFRHPNPCFGTKDQDFSLGPRITISVFGDEPGEVLTREVLLPIIAIECKTYLAKNHLDMCASTASNLHVAMPYCMYLIATEYLKMDVEVTPEFTDIHEIFVLCKATNAQRSERQKAGLPPHPIHDDLVVDLFHMVLRHLTALWWAPGEAVQRGRVIGRPL
jgi:hypothetical protein